MKQNYTKALFSRAAVLAGAFAVTALTMPAFAQTTGVPSANTAQQLRLVTTSSTAVTGTDWPADVKWNYVVNHEAGYALEYTAGQEDMPLTSTAHEVSDSRLWALIGNPTDGYKIYNKAAGPNKILSVASASNDARPILKDVSSIGTSDITTWDIFYTDDLVGAVRIAQHGTQNRLNRNGGKLGFWMGNADKGSDFIFYPYTNQEQSIKQKQANRLTYANAAANIAAGGRYIFYQTMSGRLQYLYDNGSEAQVQMKGTPQILTNFKPHLSFVWEVEAAPDNSYYLKNVATGKYVGQITAKGTTVNLVTSQADAARVTFENNNGEVAIKVVGTSEQLYFHGFEPNNGTNPSRLTTWTNAGANYQVYPVQTAADGISPYTVAVAYEGVGTNGVSTGAVAGAGVEIYPGNKALPLMFATIDLPTTTFTFDNVAFTAPQEVTGNTHKVVGVYTLPFDLTTDLSSPKWQGVQISESARYSFSAAADGSNVALVSTATAVERIQDDKLWAIKGDLVNGFEFYVRSQGVAKLAYTPDANNGTLLRLGDATANVANGKFFVERFGTGYVTYRKNGNAKAYFNNFNNELKVGYWQAADNGSKVFFTPQATLLSDARNDLATALNPYQPTKGKNIVGSLSEADYTALEAQAAAGFSTVEDFATWTQALEDRKVQYQADRFYQIIANGTSKTLYTDYATGAVKFKETTADDEVATLWKISGPSTAATIVNPNTGKGFVYPTNSNLTFNTGETAEAYQLQKGTVAASNVLYGNGFIPTVAAGNTTGTPTVTYTASADNSFHLRLMTEYKVTVGADGYATTKLPFAVTLPADGSLKAYKLTNLPSHDAATLEEITATTIPANTPVVLKGDAATYTLGIDYTNTEVALTDNLLTGVTAPGALGETDYVLANGSQGVGFYQTTEALTDFGPNKAILPASAVPAASAGAPYFIFDRVVTAVNTATKADKATVYYNLQGQRVERPTKGLYITAEGQKVLVK